MAKKEEPEDKKSLLKILEVAGGGPSLTTERQKRLRLLTQEELRHIPEHLYNMSDHPNRLANIVRELDDTEGVELQADLETSSDFVCPSMLFGKLEFPEEEEITSVTTPSSSPRPTTPEANRSDPLMPAPRMYAADQREEAEARRRRLPFTLQSVAEMSVDELKGYLNGVGVAQDDRDFVYRARLLRVRRMQERRRKGEISHFTKPRRRRLKKKRCPQCREVMTCHGCGFQTDEPDSPPPGLETPPNRDWTEGVDNGDGVDDPSQCQLSG